MRTAKIKHGKSQECISEIESEVLFLYCLILEKICNTDIFKGKKIIYKPILRDIRRLDVVCVNILGVIQEYWLWKIDLRT